MNLQVGFVYRVKGFRVLSRLGRRVSEVRVE